MEEVVGGRTVFRAPSPPSGDGSSSCDSDGDLATTATAAAAAAIAAGATGASDGGDEAGAEGHGIGRTASTETDFVRAFDECMYEDMRRLSQAELIRRIRERDDEIERLRQRIGVLERGDVFE